MTGMARLRPEWVESGHQRRGKPMQATGVDWDAHVRGNDCPPDISFPAGIFLI
jgi:hypothetical protein